MCVFVLHPVMSVVCSDLVSLDAQELLLDAGGHLGPFTEGTTVAKKRPGRKAGRPARGLPKSTKHDAVAGSTALPLQVMPAACLLHL